MGCRRRKCCECQSCCHGNPPAEWLATFTFTSTGVTTCGLCESFLSGEYALTLNDACDNYCGEATYDGGVPCCWTYDWSGDETCVLSGGDADGLTLHITDIHIEMQIRCHSTDNRSEVCHYEFYWLGYIEGQTCTGGATIQYGLRWLWARGDTIGDGFDVRRCATEVLERSNVHYTAPFTSDLCHIATEVCDNEARMAMVPNP